MTFWEVFVAAFVFILGFMGYECMVWGITKWIGDRSGGLGLMLWLIFGIVVPASFGVALLVPS